MKTKQIKNKLFCYSMPFTTGNHHGRISLALHPRGEAAQGQSTCTLAGTSTETGAGGTRLQSTFRPQHIMPPNGVCCHAHSCTSRLMIWSVKACCQGFPWPCYLENLLHFQGKKPGSIYWKESLTKP